MKALHYDAFGAPIELQTVPDPTPSAHGVVLKVNASGMCRSDWHGWRGHDPAITPPHVPGHEIAGEVVASGSAVDQWSAGDRVTLPFVCGCGRCAQCAAGHQQVCPQQFQPGFHGWGSFAEYVSVDYADTNLVRLPPEVDDITASVLGCRFATAFRAVVDQGDVSAGQWVAIHGCGGVGLSAVMIARAVGAQVVAVDISDEALALARDAGADATINARSTENIVEAVTTTTDGGAHVSIDALGSAETCFNSVANLRKRGTHVQVGLMVGDDQRAAVPMARVIADELDIRGTHGIQTHRYSALLAMVQSGSLRPDRLIRRTIPLEDAASVLMNMDAYEEPGITVIDSFP